MKLLRGDAFVFLFYEVLVIRKLVKLGLGDRLYFKLFFYILIEVIILFEVRDYCFNVRWEVMFIVKFTG